MSDYISRQAAIDEKHERIFQEIVIEYPSYTIYQEYKGKPYFSIKYTENGQEFIGYGTYKPEVLSEFLKEYFMPSTQQEQQWTPCSARLPEENEMVLISAKYIGHLSKMIHMLRRDFLRMMDGIVPTEITTASCLLKWLHGCHYLNHTKEKKYERIN